MANVTGSLSSQGSFTFTKTTNLPTGGLTTTLSFPAFVQSFTNGTGTGQIDMIYVATLSLAGTTTDLDLTALVDPFTGGTYNMARAKFVLVRNSDATNGITLGAAASNPWIAFLTGTAPTAPVAAGGFVAFVSPLATGYAVSGSSKTLRLNPGANTVSVDIAIGGCSA